MPSYRGSSGKTYKLEEKPFAGGGEGKIYAVSGAPRLVAKIYHDGLRTQGRQKKLSVMMGSAPSGSAADYFTWPKDVLSDSRGHFCGYVMQRLETKKRLNEIYTFDHRSGRTWEVYIAIAKNLSAAIDAVHKRGHVCGDLNPNNICVNPDTGIVTLVDTDSYHIKDPISGKTYRCEVGMAEFVPKNLQGINFKTAVLPTFTTETDAFALAVLIFALLMNGAHPYACSVTSDVSGNLFQPVSNIANDFYPYSVSAKGVSIPKYAPQITALPKEMQNMFVLAFLPKPGAKRPTPRDWYYALEKLSGQLKKCGKNAGHIYYNALKDCPWCQVREQLSGLNRKLKGHTPRKKSVKVIKTTPTPTPAPKPKPRPFSFSFPGSADGPTVLVWIVTILYSGAIGYGAFWLINRFIFSWGVLGGIVAGITVLINARAAGSDFIDDPGVINFLIFLVTAPFYAAIQSVRNLIITVIVILGISLALSILASIFG